MSSNRADRVAGEIKKIVSELMRTEMKDPRLPLLCSVTEVKVNRDLSLATIYLSTLGGKKEKEDMMAAVEQAKGFFRSRVAKALRLRLAPELRFLLDESIEEALRMTRLIDDVMADDARRERENGMKEAEGE